MKRYLLSSILLLLFAGAMLAQIKMPLSFEQLLNDAQLSFNKPTENKYKTLRPTKNSIFNYDFSIKAKRGDLEIRYAIKKINKKQSELIFPHILSMNTASHIASNHSDAEVVVQHVSNEDLKTIFKADWAAVFYFSPKHQFSKKRNCKMLSLYKESVGLVYVFFLFNKTSIDLDNQFYTLNFES